VLQIKLHIRLAEVSFLISSANLLTGPYVIREMLPATHYFALCGIGIQFPRLSDPFKAAEEYVYKIHRGANKNCEPLRAEVNGMNEGQGNLHFCTISKLAHDAMAGERYNTIDPIEEPPWSGMNHRRRCDKFLKDFPGLAKLKPMEVPW
jgi:hypothetical protein